MRIYPNYLKNRILDMADARSIIDREFRSLSAAIVENFCSTRTFGILIFLLLPTLIFSAPNITDEDGVRRVHAHLLIKDITSAIREAEELYEAFPHSQIAAKAYIEALSLGGFEEKALHVWNQLFLQEPTLIEDRHLLEELSFGVLNRGIIASQYVIRLTALIGIYLTQDIRAVPIFVNMMHDTNAVVRSVAVQMAAHFGDALVHDEIQRLLKEEKIWFVRLEVIKAAGVMRMKEAAPLLKEILMADRYTFEERQYALQALTQIYDAISFDELAFLARSPRAGMRHLACSLVSHFQIKGAEALIQQLLLDTNPDVRVAAINAVGLVFLDQRSSFSKAIISCMHDANASVSITAAWAGALMHLPEAESCFLSWLRDTWAEYRRLAAAALATTGDCCRSLMKTVMQESTDPYVRANIALGLMSQRLETEKCCDTIYQFLTSDTNMWMWDSSHNPLFSALSPSRVRHVDHIPNYPEAIDQMTRLRLVSTLALLDDPRAEEVLKGFLKKKSWGITGVAAALLLQEGDAGSLELVRGLLNDEDQNVKLQACLVLSLLGHDETVTVELKHAYAQATREQKLQILEALAQVGRLDSVPFLLGVLQEPFQVLRIASAACIIRGINQ